MTQQTPTATSSSRRVRVVGRLDLTCPPIDTWVDDLDVELSIEPDPHQAPVKPARSGPTRSLDVPSRR